MERIPRCILWFVSTAPSSGENVVWAYSSIQQYCMLRWSWNPVRMIFMVIDTEFWKINVSIKSEGNCQWCPTRFSNFVGQYWISGGRYPRIALIKRPYLHVFEMPAHIGLTFLHGFYLQQKNPCAFVSVGLLDIGIFGVVSRRGNPGIRIFRWSGQINFGDFRIGRGTSKHCV